MLAAVLLASVVATFQAITPATTAQTPQVFVRDASVQAQPGDGGHDFGLRPPLDNDSDAAPLYNAHGDPLRVVLGVWRTADGTAAIEPAQGALRVRAMFHHLIPNGRYSVFVRQLAIRTGPVFTPLDVIGQQNSFSADAQGNGGIVTVTAFMLPTGTQLVLIYHSDGVDHQSSLGLPGVNAHAQLITRVP
jgi:hypothetical protein